MDTVRADGPTVLVVDDEEDVCRNLADILEDLGCRVDTASDGSRALEMIRRTRYDAGLLDLKMPGLNGVALCNAIKAFRRGTVPILVPAYASAPAAEAATRAGAWQIVSKPVDLPAL